MNGIEFSSFKYQVYWATAAHFNYNIYVSKYKLEDVFNEWLARLGFLDVQASKV